MIHECAPFLIFRAAFFFVARFRPFACHCFRDGLVSSWFRPSQSVSRVFCSMCRDKPSLNPLSPSRASSSAAPLLRSFSTPGVAVSSVSLLIDRKLRVLFQELRKLESRQADRLGIG